MERIFYALSPKILIKKTWDRFRSRRFMSFLFFILFIIVIIVFKLSPKSRRTSSYSTIELEACIESKLDRYAEGVQSMNVVVSEWPDSMAEPKPSPDPKQNTNLVTQPANLVDATFGTISDGIASDQDEHLFLPYAGNGYIGQSLLGRLGLHASYQKSLSLQLLYNPLVQIYTDTLPKKESTVVEFSPGLVHRIQCFQNNKDCISVQNTLYAHRTRPSVLVEEITLNNPSKESFTFDVIQSGAINWNQSKVRVENLNGIDFTISNGIIDTLIDNKPKHLCISIGSTRLPVSVRIKEHDFNQKHHVLTVVKYSTAFLSGKLENLQPVLSELESKVVEEIKEILGLGYIKLKKEHIEAWNTIWHSGFGISNSLASGAINGDQLNASIYYVLSNNRAPLLEVTKLALNSSLANNNEHAKFHMERCYEGFSTLHALKLWKVPRSEAEISALSSLWSLTLQKHGCRTLIELGVDGVLQAIILSIGGFKFTNHHLDLNLNPRQLHRDYQFRQLNYANHSLLTVEVEVGSDNHALLYVTLDKILDPGQRFYACDAGCIDPPVELSLNTRLQFPVKLTNPITAILYISNDKVHINELKHALHVQEVDIAPAQDVNSIAIHKHGHHLAGMATLFWTLFVILIIIFHLFLIKLVYREMCSNSAAGASDSKNSYSSSSYDSNKKYRYTRTV